jgi:hypothetical protein
MVFIDPISQTRFMCSRSNSDMIIAPATGEPVLDMDSIPIVGNFIDNAGEVGQTSGAIPKWTVAWGAVVNEFDGTDAGVYGARFAGVNALGDCKPTHRLRQKYTFLETKNMPQGN